MASAFDRNTKLEWIAVKNLSVVWADAQRPLSASHAKRIADNFDPDLFGELAVTMPNGNGIYHIIDGQHRKTGLETLYGGEEKAPCRIYPETDPARAAEIFLGINAPQNRKSPSTVSRFLIAVKAGHHDECEVNRIVRTNGYRICLDGNAKDGIRCVGKLLYVFRRIGANHLAAALQCIRSTWGVDRASVDGAIVTGYASLLVEHSSKINRTRLQECMGKMTPAKLLVHAKNLAESLNQNLSDGVRLVLMNYYNKSLPKDKRLRSKGE